MNLKEKAIQVCKEFTNESFSNIKDLQAVLRVLSESKSKFKNKKRKKKKEKIYCQEYRDVKLNGVCLQNTVFDYYIIRPSYETLETYFKYKSFSFFNRNTLHSLCNYDQAYFIANKLVSTLFKPGLNRARLSATKASFIFPIMKKKGMIRLIQNHNEEIHFGFIPSSPNKNIKQHSGVNMINIPIEANWHKDVFLEGLSRCAVFSGFQKEDYLVTHVVNHFHSEALEDNQIDIYEGWVLLGSKETLESRNTNKSLKEVNTEVTVNGLRSVRVLLIKLSTLNYCYGLNFPDTTVVNLKTFIQETVQKIKGLIASETLALITKEKPPTFRSLFRGLSPVPFDTDCDKDIVDNVSGTLTNFPFCPSSHNEEIADDVSATPKMATL